MKIRKKLVIVPLTLAMALPCVACGSDGNSQNISHDSGQNEPDTTTDDGLSRIVVIAQNLDITPWIPMAIMTCSLEM